MSDHKEVLAVCESVNGKLLPISTEVLSISSKLASELNTVLSTVIIGDQNAAGEAIAFGADKVYKVSNIESKSLENDTVTGILQTVVENIQPGIVVMGQDDMGREQAPFLAYHINACSTLDCINLEIKDFRLIASKPVYGGNAIATFTCESEPYIVTIRSKAMAASEPDASRQGEIIDVEIPAQLLSSRLKTTDSVIEESTGIKLEDASIIVSGGRGIGASDGFKLLEELAQTLGGAVGASRPPCDNGWIADTAQVGLTGKIVAPELYIAVAISGSSQHMSGCSGARTIVAINKDKEANIFRHARFGIVGDWKKILPAFTNKIKELVSS